MRARARHDGERQEQALGGDEAVAGLLGRLLRLLEHAPDLRREVDLARAGSLDAGLLRELGLDRGERLLRIGAGRAQQVGSQALAVVEKDLEQVLGREPLVAAALREHLRGLEEAAGAFRVDLWIHGIEPLWMVPWRATRVRGPRSGGPRAIWRRGAHAARPDAC